MLAWNIALLPALLCSARMRPRYSNDCFCHLTLQQIILCTAAAQVQIVWFSWISKELPRASDDSDWHRTLHLYSIKTIIRRCSQSLKLTMGAAGGGRLRPIGLSVARGLHGILGTSALLMTRVDRGCQGGTCLEKTIHGVGTGGRAMMAGRARRGA